MIEEYDQFKQRCRLLGHDVNFKYCRIVNNNLPCSKIIDCWYEKISIQKYLNKYFDKDTIAKILSPPKAKIATLYELIEKAKEADKE